MKVSTLALWFEDHHISWVLQSGRIFALEVCTIQVGETILVRSTWLDATDWDRATLTAWLGY